MKIPATKLQQFIGMDDYERKLTIDRLSRELGLSITEIENEIRDFEQGINSVSYTHLTLPTIYSV